MVPLRRKNGPAEFLTHKSNHLNSSTAVFYTSIIFGKNISCSLRSGPGGFTIEGMVYLLVFCVYSILNVLPQSLIFESVWKDQGSFRFRSSRFNSISATPHYRGIFQSFTYCETAQRNQEESNRGYDYLTNFQPHCPQERHSVYMVSFGVPKPGVPVSIM